MIFKVQIETRDGSRRTGGIKPWRLSEYQSGQREEHPSTIFRQLAWNESEFKKSMNRVSIQDYELKSLLDQVMNSRTSLYGALQGKIFPIKKLRFKKFLRFDCRCWTFISSYGTS